MTYRSHVSSWRRPRKGSEWFMEPQGFSGTPLRKRGIFVNLGSCTWTETGWRGLSVSAVQHNKLKGGVLSHAVCDVLGALQLKKTGRKLWSNGSAEEQRTLNSSILDSLPLWIRPAPNQTLLIFGGET